MNPYCKNTDIALYIVVGGKRLPICAKCWEEIADSDLEWGEGISARAVKRRAEEEREKLHQKILAEAMHELLAGKAEEFKHKMGRSAATQVKGFSS
jgi:hypothetical protein